MELLIATKFVWVTVVIY